MRNPFRYFNSSPEVIRVAVMMYIRYPLSLRQVEDLLFERGIDICHETVRCWWNRFGPMFAAEIRKRRIHQHRCRPQWRWHLDEVFVKISGESHYLWRAVDHEGQVLEVFASKRRDRKAALKFLKRTMKRHGRPKAIVTDRLRSYRAAMNMIGNAGSQARPAWIRYRNSMRTGIAVAIPSKPSPPTSLSDTQGQTIGPGATRNDSWNCTCCRSGGEDRYQTSAAVML